MTLDGLPLFDPPPASSSARAAAAPRSDTKRVARERAARRFQAEIAHLAPIARALATKARAYGITAADITDAGIAHGLITGHERDRTRSYMSSVPRAAGLTKAHPERRRYDKKSRNDQVVWVLPEFEHAPPLPVPPSEDPA